MNLVKVKCDNCMEEFERYPSHIVGRKNIFCSVECMKKYHRPTVLCIGCGEQFVSNPRMPKNQYCSWDCFKKSRWLEVVCFQCGKLFQKRLCEVEKAEKNGNKHMCSRACRNVYTSFHLGGDGTWVPGGKHHTPSWYDGRYGWDWGEIRWEALKRWGYKCAQCATKKNLHVHHWEPYRISLDNGQDNLVVLCRDCHVEKHEEYRKEGFYEDLHRHSGW